jgi:hypothetical protein
VILASLYSPPVHVWKAVILPSDAESGSSERTVSAIDQSNTEMGEAALAAIDELAINEKHMT